MKDRIKKLMRRFRPEPDAETDDHMEQVLEAMSLLVASTDADDGSMITGADSNGEVFVVLTLRGDCVDPRVAYAYLAHPGEV